MKKSAAFERERSYTPAMACEAFAKELKSIAVSTLTEVENHTYNDGGVDKFVSWLCKSVEESLATYKDRIKHSYAKIKKEP
jgi:hypothetical protein